MFTAYYSVCLRILDMEKKLYLSKKKNVFFIKKIQFLKIPMSKVVVKFSGFYLLRMVRKKGL